MSEEAEDDGQKTEEPTDHKLREAAREGNVPLSREVGVLTSLAAAAVGAAYLWPRAAAGIAEAMLPFVENPGGFSVADGLADLAAALGHVLWLLALAVAPLFLAFLAAAAAAAKFQGELVFAAKRLEPKLSKLDPLAGAKRLASASNLVEFLKNMAKVAVVAWAAWAAASEEVARLAVAVDLASSAVPGLVSDAVTRMLLDVLVAVVAIAALDVFWKRHEHRKKMRMSMKDIRDEHKNMEGDPHVKGRLQEIRRERARQRQQIAAVPTATVMITNPTHFSIALLYEPGKHEAPVCVAKGQDGFALELRREARKHGVPIVENKPLARALYPMAAVDQQIPYQHWAAVAEIIKYVLKAKGGAAPGPRRGPGASA